MFNSIILDVIEPAEPESVQISNALIYVIPVVLFGIAVVALVYFRKKYQK